MKQLIGKSIEAVEVLESGVVKITLDEGTLLANIIALPSELGEAEEEKAPAKKEAKAPAKPAKEEKAKPKKKTWQDLVDMEEDELKELIDEDEIDVDADDFEDDEDGLREAIAEELEIEIPKKAPAKGKKEEKEEEDEKLAWSDLVEMDRDEMEELIDDEELDVDADDFEDDDEGLRKAIAKEMKIEVPKKGKK